MVSLRKRADGGWGSFMWAWFFNLCFGSVLELRLHQVRNSSKESSQVVLDSESSYWFTGNMSLQNIIEKGGLEGG